MKKGESCDDEASAKKLDELIEGGDGDYLIEDVGERRNGSVVFGSASLFTSFCVSDNGTVGEINDVVNDGDGSTAWIFRCG